MPPRSAKKASAKKPSLRVKKLSSAAAAAKASPEALLAAEEEVKVPLMEVQLAAKEKVVGPEEEEGEEEEEEASLAAAEKVPEADARTPPKVHIKEEMNEAEEAAPSVAREEVGRVLKEEVMEEADVPPEKLEDLQAAPSEAAEVVEPAEHPEVLADVRESNDGPSEINTEEGAQQNIAEEGCRAAEVEDVDVFGAVCGDEMGYGNKSASDDDSDSEEDIDPSIYMHAPMTERKRNKEFEIFVGGLGKDAVEDDLTNVFGEFGEVQSARIVKHPVTQKSKGFAFIRYATVEQAKKVLAELKDGTEVKGKRVGVSASLDNDTLYLGNICKTWSKDHVLETIKGFGVKQVEEVLLPDDPKNEGKNKGFAFLEFASHSDAIAAFQRLRQPDAIFGRDRSAKVAFAQSSMHPSEEALSQVKTVYVDGLPLSWDEKKVKEICKQYGEVEKVHLSRNFTKNKRKDFGFVAFTSRESAVACVEGINSAQLGEGEVKVKANLAKPQRKGRFAKQGPRGGFKVKKDGESTKEAGQFNIEGQKEPKDTLGKGNTLPKLKGTKESKSSKSQGKAAGHKAGPHDRQKMVQPLKGGKRSGKGMDSENSVRPSKKARNDRNFVNFHSRPTNAFGTQRNAHFGKSKSNYMMHPTTYAPGYVAPSISYPSHVYAGASVSKRWSSDMEPHAGYIPAATQGRDPYGYAQRRVGDYDNQQRIGAVEYDNRQRTGAGGFVTQHRIGAGEYDNQYKTGAGAYDNRQRIVAGSYDNQQRIVAGGYDSQQRIVTGGYDNPQMMGVGGYDNQQRVGAGGYDNQPRIDAGYVGAGSVLQSSYPGYSSYAGYETGYGSYAPQQPYY